MSDSSALESTFEWSAYVASATPETFGLLVRASEVRQQPLFTLLQRHLAASLNWRVAQHLAQLLLRTGQVLYAEYYANRALALSNGDPFARMSLATALWERRLPDAVLYQTKILRVQARRVRPRLRRRLLQQRIAELHCMCAAYGCDRLSLTRWYRSISHFKRSTADVLTRVCVAFSPPEAPPEALDAATRLALAAALPRPNSRAHYKVTAMVHRAFLLTLRARS